MDEITAVRLFRVHIAPAGEDVRADVRAALRAQFAAEATPRRRWWRFRGLPFSRRPRHALALVGGLAAMIVLVAGAVVANDEPKSTFSIEAAREFSGFSLFYLGPSFDGEPLTAVLRRDDGPRYVSFIYGECDAVDDRGCAPSVEVQVWPLCVRKRLVSGSAPGGASEATQIRGVPAAFFEGGSRLEVATGDAAVVIFAGGRERALHVAQALRGINVSAAAGRSLPAPTDAAC